ncbi:hypothetical protein TNCV_45051 [Trichonephila clavipes]|nr:hypothetical protein TNCV_45051 [Trichonephila clavipes]
MRPLEDARKIGWTMADFTVMMVAVDLGLQQISLSNRKRLEAKDNIRELYHSIPCRVVTSIQTRGVENIENTLLILLLCNCVTLK